MLRAANSTVTALPGRLAVWALALAISGLLTGPGSSWAAPGTSGGTPPPPPTESLRVRNDNTTDISMAQRVLPASVQIAGTVKDAPGTPLSGVRVRLFSNGVSLETVLTNAAGEFVLTANPMSGENHTSDIWIESPDSERYLDVNVVLAKGKVATEQKLYSACTPEVDVNRNGAVIEVTMFSVEEKKKIVRELGCLSTEP